jgi:para-aminobenzoate synthetase component 1
LPTPGEDDMTFPDLILGFYDVVIAFDHMQQRAWILASGYPETKVTAQAARAQARIQAFRAKVDTAPQEIRIPPNPDEGVKIESNFSRPAYEAAVQRVIDYIYAGDIFQANISQRFRAQLSPDDSPLALYHRLRTINPAPFAAYLDFDDTVIASASPERFLLLRDDWVETRPIKGTRPRGATPEEDRALADELLDSEKDRAENVMIVDLLRNDLSRVCQDHSVKTPEICVLESFATVHHLVSTVEGRLNPGADAVDLLRATIPGGSITGAPKIRAMEIIAELEPTWRGPYCGNVGYISFSGDMDTSIVIRTYAIRGDQVTFQAGGGIVADSDPAAEYDETIDKARALIDALGK